MSKPKPDAHHSHLSYHTLYMSQIYIYILNLVTKEKSNWYKQTIQLTLVHISRVDYRLKTSTCFFLLELPNLLKSNFPL